MKEITRHLTPTHIPKSSFGMSIKVFDRDRKQEEDMYLPPVVH